MIAVAVFAAVGFSAGACLLVSGIRPTAPAPARTTGSAVGPGPRIPSLAHRVVDQARSLDGRRVAVACGVGLGVWLVTRWPVAAVGAAVAAWWIPWPGQRADRKQDEARTSALAAWCESLRDAAGTARGLEGILTTTAAAAPQAIRPELTRMATRLQSERLDVVLDGLAEDLHHPVGDLVVTALRLASSAGSRRVRQVLSDLAEAAQLEASMLRRVDVARQRPRSTMRLVAVIVAAFVAGLLLFARDYLAPYGTSGGQVVLAVVAGYWALGFWWMARLGRVAQLPRVLVDRKGMGG